MNFNIDLKSMRCTTILRVYPLILSPSVAVTISVITVVQFNGNGFYYGVA